jgi:hypothetical protein
MALGNNQDMGWCLWRNIIEGNHFIGIRNKRGPELTRDDLAEDTVLGTF